MNEKSQPKSAFEEATGIPLSQKKLTFEEWYTTQIFFDEDRDRVIAEAAWEAAQENK